MPQRGSRLFISCDNPSCVDGWLWFDWLKSRKGKCKCGCEFDTDTVSWLQEQGETLLAPSVEERTEIENPQIGPQKMLRYWVYSHHIYSKVKRKDLQGLASDLRLTGFVLPGKPGVIAVEVI